MHVKPPSGAQIHLPALSVSGAVSSTAIRPKAPDLNFRLLDEIVTLPGSAGPCRGQANSLKVCVLPRPAPSSNENTHQDFSTAKPRTCQRPPGQPTPAGRVEHLMGEHRPGQTALPVVCVTLTTACDRHCVLLFYGTLSCTAVKQGMGRKKKTGNKAGESVREAERATGSNTGPSTLLD